MNTAENSEEQVRYNELREHVQKERNIDKENINITISMNIIIICGFNYNYMLVTFVLVTNQVNLRYSVLCMKTII